jgi:hypothetical protein
MWYVLIAGPLGVQDFAPEYWTVWSVARKTTEREYKRLRTETQVTGCCWFPNAPVSKSALQKWVNYEEFIVSSQFVVVSMFASLKTII